MKNDDHICRFDLIWVDKDPNQCKAANQARSHCVFKGSRARTAGFYKDP